MFAVRFLVTIAHTVMTALLWRSYFLSVQWGQIYSPEVLRAAHYRPPSLFLPLNPTVIGIFMWATLVHLAFKRDRELDQ